MLFHVMCITGATVVDGQVYMIGGASGRVGMKSCVKYDSSTATWSTIAPLNEG